MPIIDHKNAPETPWRPNYRQWDLVGPEDGVSSILSMSTVGQGAGAPLHYHEADELIVILDGTVQVRLGDERREVGPEHTLAIPARVPHAFSAVGSGGARILTFFPVPDPFAHTTYLEGGAPEVHGE